MVTPHNSTTRPNVIQPSYNEANLLEKVDVWLRQSTAPKNLLNPTTADLQAVTNIDYNAKGQRTLIEYGNQATTSYEYDTQTFRLTRMLTIRPQSPFNETENQSVQDLRYTYDPVGNITYIYDHSDIQNIIYFRNQRVEPSSSYEYDPLYRLVKATGREHLGQTEGKPNPPTAPDAFNEFHTGLDHPGNGNAMGTYIERYLYDAVGNILSMQHRGSNPAHPGWTRTYAYNEASLLEPTKQSNRLSNTRLTGNNPLVSPYLHDAHGNMIRIPHLANHADATAANMHWDYKDQLQQADLGGGGTAYYVYDAAGQRTRKVVEKSPGLTEERIYLGGFEVFRKRNGTGTIILERETLHVMDDQQRIALVETRTVDTANTDTAPSQLIRYQLSNHLGSYCLELNEGGQVISYEEYYPYGSTSYQAVQSGVEVSQKRYRYTGKERDEETGLNYHGARYYGPWLGRWTAIQVRGQGNVQGEAYEYVRQIATEYAFEIRRDTGNVQYGATFIRIMLELAAHESHGTFGQRAQARGVVYHPDPQRRGQSSSFGVFQTTKIAWRGMLQELGDPEWARSFPHESSAFEEVAVPIRYYARIYRQILTLGNQGVNTAGESIDVWAARVVLVRHMLIPSEYNRFLNIARRRGFQAAWNLLPTLPQVWEIPEGASTPERRRIELHNRGVPIRRRALRTAVTGGDVNRRLRTVGIIGGAPTTQDQRLVRELSGLEQEISISGSWTFFE